MKNLPLLLATALILMSTVSALEISADLDSNIIVKEFENTLNGIITIENAVPGTYNVYSLSDIVLSPNEIFEIKENGTYEKEIELKLSQSLKTLGRYTFEYTLNHRGVEKVSDDISVEIVEIADILEVTSESVDVEKGTIKFSVQNNKDVEIKNLQVEFSSIFFNTSKEFDLEPLKKVVFEEKVNSNVLEKTKAGAYTITATIQTPKGEKEVIGNLFIGEKKGIQTAEDESGFLIRTQTISKINAGNVLENVEVKIEKNIFSRLFTSFNEDPSIINRQGMTIEYVWLKDNLGPTEIYTIKAKTNYILPTIILILAVITIYSFRRYAQTKVEITKTVHPVKTKNGEFALKISLNVKARKSVENVSIVDKIPAIVKLYNKFGTQKPDKIDTNNRRVHWNIGDLNPGEERVFSYIVYSKVGVVGKFVLPEALVVFEKENQIHEVESKKVFFMTDQVEE